MSQYTQVPIAIYYDSEMVNFYHLESHKGQGHSFFAQWYKSRDEFPQKKRNGSQARMYSRDPDQGRLGPSARQ